MVIPECKCSWKYFVQSFKLREWQPAARHRASSQKVESAAVCPWQLNWGPFGVTVPHSVVTCWSLTV